MTNNYHGTPMTFTRSFLNFSYLFTSSFGIASSSIAFVSTFEPTIYFFFQNLKMNKTSYSCVKIILEQFNQQRFYQLLLMLDSPHSSKLLHYALVQFMQVII